MAKLGLGIDGGGSSTRWLLRDSEGGEQARGRTGPFTGHVFTEKDREANLSCLAGIAAEVLKVARPSAVVGGITGLHGGTEAAAFLTGEMARLFGLEAKHIRLDNDMSVAYASAFAPGEGVLVYAGTGSVGYHVTANGEVVRAGGYGYLIDDYGGGYWIGHEGIKQTMRWVDELGHPADRPLARHIYEAIGSDDWDEIIAVIYGEGRSRVAALAPAVAAAAREGDEAAVGILKNAGRELARLARVIMARLKAPQPVAFIGGITRLSPHLTEALQAALPAESAFEVLEAEPVEAAARLALRL